MVVRKLKYDNNRGYREGKREGRKNSGNKGRKERVNNYHLPGNKA